MVRALGITFKFYTIVAKGLQVKVKVFLERGGGVISYVSGNYGGKTGRVQKGRLFGPSTSLPSILNKTIATNNGLVRVAEPDCDLFCIVSTKVV